MRAGDRGSVRVVRVLGLLVVAGVGAVPAAGAAQDESTREARVPRARLLRIPSDSIPNMVGGRVVDFDTGRPVVGVQVYLRGTQTGALTDHSGEFRLDGPGPGPRELGVRVIGYLGGCFNVTLSPGEMQSLLIAIPRRRSNETPRVILGCQEPEDVTPPRDGGAGPDGRR